jgi:glucose-6-phosphate 1-dehydrogenase
VLLGVAGDLMTRHLMPALLHLESVAGLEGVSFVGLDRADLDDERLRARAAESLDRAGHDVPADTVARLLARLHYQRTDLTGASRIPEADASSLVYVALPPRLLPLVAELLARSEDPPRRLLVEKPYGTSLESAAELDTLLHRVVPESELLRADHLLHHGPVRDLDLVARRLARLLPAVRTVHVRWDESAALGERAAEFDEVGVVRDMVNSHLLQLAATVLAAVPPHVADEEARQARDEVLRDLELTGHGPASPWIRARYSTYAEEPGVAPERGTETFVSIALRLRRPGHDVDVRLTTGKALSPVRREVVLHLDDGELPGTVRLDLSGTRLQMTEDADEDTLDAPSRHAPASAHLLSDARAGILRRFVSAEACARQWVLTEAIADALADLPMGEYLAGSSGPEVP